MRDHKEGPKEHSVCKSSQIFKLHKVRIGNIQRREYQHAKLNFAVNELGKKQLIFKMIGTCQLLGEKLKAGAVLFSCGPNQRSSRLDNDSN